MLSSTKYTMTSGRWDCATKMAFISVWASISLWASLPTASRRSWLSVGADLALNTKTRIAVSPSKCSSAAVQDRPRSTASQTKANHHRNDTTHHPFRGERIEPHCRPNFEKFQDVRPAPALCGRQTNMSLQDLTLHLLILFRGSFATESDLETLSRHFCAAFLCRLCHTGNAISDRVVDKFFMGDKA